MRNRPVGIGMMGFQDALYQLGINFDSEEGIAFADNSMEAVSYYAIEASSDLAKERGVYETFRGSKWDRGIFPKDTIQLLEQERGSKIDVDMSATMDWVSLKEKVQKQGMRNSNCMAIAPTATISNIAGCTPTIEPMYKNIFVKANQAGDFTIVNPFLVAELKGLKLWDAEMLGKLKYNDGSIAKITEIPQDIKDRYKEVFEIAPEWLIRAAAQRGKWIDQSQSLNIFYNGKSGRELSAIYLRAWDKGLKTTYYLRSLGASQVEKSTVKIVDHGVTHTRNSAETPSTASSAIQKVGIMSLSGTAKDVAELPVNMGKNVPSQTTSLPKIAPKIRTGVVPQQEPQLCKIEDPDCEACQ
jgi:ribonucleoside-diphosphate reductase alpha chain